ncbi:MAG: rhamnogalacturonan acetylesterase [Luteolibacter sp.]
MRSIFRFPLLCLLFLVCGSLFAADSKKDDRPVVREKKSDIEHKTNDSLPTLWIIGDSTVKSSNLPFRGWGEEFSAFFDLEKINVINRAIGGRSSRTFLTDGRWDDILKELRPGDFVIMQFGHNDGGAINEDPPITKKTRARGTIKGNGEETVFVEKNIITGKTETVHTYGWYLRNYVTTAKEKGVTTIICSPVPRQAWTEDGKLVRAYQNYGTWAKEAAGQSGALFVDLHEISSRGYEKIGAEAVKKHFADAATHTTVEGARYNATSIISALNALPENPLAPYFSDQGKAVPAFAP